VSSRTGRARTTLGIALTSGVLFGASLLPSPAAGDPEAPTPSVHRPAPDRQLAPQTSDGRPGAIAPWVPREQRTIGTWSTLAAWQVVPGVSFEKFDLVDERGPIRGHLLRIDTHAPGISFDYGGRPQVASTAPLLQTVLADQAIAGDHGDFFDISDNGAPLGVGRDRQRKLLHGVVSGWNCAFFVTRDHGPDIDFIYASARIVQFPLIEIETINSPSVRQGGIGLYTDKWGVLNNRVVDGQKDRVRMVVVQDGHVVKNTRKIPKKMPVKGKVLIGRDQGAYDLAQLKGGTPVTVKAKLSPRAKMAITGNVFIIRDGERKARDDREMHPRTAIGIDYDTGFVYLLVVDGRQSFSRGYTMVELAEFFEAMGVDEALNLDGGGSSTMVAQRRNGKVKVLNSPSDGHQRPVPNGLLVSYDPTASGPIDPVVPPVPPVPPTPPVPTP